MTGTRVSTSSSPRMDAMILSPSAGSGRAGSSGGIPVASASRGTRAIAWLERHQRGHQRLRPRRPGQDRRSRASAASVQRCAPSTPGSVPVPA